MLVDDSRASFGFACWSGDPGPMTVAHRHDDVEINLAGRDVDYLLNGARLTIPAGHAGVFWGSRPHQLVDVAEGTRVTWLTVPLNEFLSWDLPHSFVAALLRGDLIVAGGPPTGLGGDFARWEADAKSGSEFALGTSRLEVQAFLRRVSSTAKAAGTRSPNPSARAGLESVASMVAFIASRFGHPISVADVSASAHVQPSYAMALFKRVVGVTIGTYITQCRIAEAQRLLIATDLAVSGIASTAGFGSTSQFYDRFHHVCGMSPSAFRRSNSLRDDVLEAARPATEVCDPGGA